MAETRVVDVAAPGAPTIAGAYLALVRSRIAAQLSYRTSFVTDALVQVLGGIVEFAELYVVFHQVPALGGFSFAEVGLMFGLATAAFGLADMAVGHVDRLPFYWTPARVALLVVTPLAGAVIFSAVFVATWAIGFWLVEGMEFANAFTYGGNYLSSFPFTIFSGAIRHLFTFVVPAAFVAYLPSLAG